MPKSLGEFLRNSSLPSESQSSPEDAAPPKLFGYSLFPQVVSGLIISFTSTAAVPRAGLDLGDIRSRREVSCKDGEYPNNNICCVNCPAGTHLKSACTTPGEKGQCEECEAETHMEHANHLSQCFTCTPCPSDQESVRSCSHTQNTKCQCKEGRFCLPDQPCEMCKKCSRCGKDEKVVRNCTATSNTECKKIPLQSVSSSAYAVVSVIVLPICLALVGVCLCKRKRDRGSEANELKAEHVQERKYEETQRPRCSSLIFSQPRVRVQSSAAMEDECQALCESRNSSASNSQQNLTSLPPARLPASAHQACLIASQPNLREEEAPFPELIPVNGEESLRKCFQYFEEVDLDYYKRFFRQLGLNSNVIKSKDQLPYDEKIHELLNIWYEKEGKDASLNDLLTALLEFDQRRTAEIIKAKALGNGLYILKK
ncbi:hematopoietic death receptor isoform X2 [Phycodurus eques]|uniref:hematopoietic death receptor isoform X2 n=1 Tax=Phycodurus eques TaxID=693459 RepID=UPI002ACDBB36|nr:hematopoietic death receptor isoform X2 [Phycodurus eques]